MDDFSSDLGGDELRVLGDVGPDMRGLMMAEAGGMPMGDDDAGGGGEGDGGLEAVMEGLDLRRLSEEEVADLESGDEGRIQAAIRVASRLTEDEDDGGRLPGRISLKAIESREEKRALLEATRMLRDGEAGSLKEALSRVWGMMGDEVANRMPEGAGMMNGGGMQAEADDGMPGVAGDDVEEMSAFPQGVEGEVLPGEERLVEMQREVDARRAQYDFTGAEELQGEMMQMRMQMREAADERRMLVARFSVEEDASRARALDQYGGLLEDEAGSFNFFLEAEIALAEKSGDSILHCSDWPEKIASRAFEKHSTFVGGGAADPGREWSDERTPPAPRTGVRMPGSPVGGGANSMALTASAALSEFERLSPEEQRGVLDELDRTRL